MNNNVTRYINYFRQLAVSHADLKHDPASETGDCEPGAQRFTTISVEKVLSALRSKIGYPCQTLELFDLETESEIVYYVKQKPRGAFMIVDRPENENAEEQSYAKCFTIMQQMLQQVWQHHYGPAVNRCETPFKEFSFNKLQITPVGPIFGTCVGYRCEFDFELHEEIDFTTPPAPGIFT